MATERAADGTLTRWYQSRIGETSTDDEVQGYWVFALGVILGIVGILLFLPSASGDALRQWAIVAASTGLAMVFAGPIIRLPLQRRATLLVYVGLALCGAAVLWFIVAFPSQWSPTTGQPQIIGLYSLGLLAIGAGGVFVPLLTAGAEAEAERVALKSEVEDLRQALLDTEADESDIAGLMADLESALKDMEADEADLAGMVEGLRSDVADTEADEADLAAELDSLRASQARFELYEDKASEWRWRLRHRNGNLIANSGEGYTRLHNAENGMQSIRRNALGAETLLIESEEELPEAEEPFEPVEEVESQATFEVSGDNAGEYRWRLRHDNGNIIGDGAEGYHSKSNVKRAINRIREYVGPADYLWFDPTGFEVYQDAANEWRWRLVHKNGNILADGGEGYTRRNDANRAVDRLRERADELEFETFEDNAGEYRWRLLGGNDQILADSGEGYDSKSGAEDAIGRVREYAPDAEVLEIGRAAFEIYEDKGGEHRWRLRHRNGNILMDSGEGYASRSKARDGIESVKRNAPNAESRS